MNYFSIPFLNSLNTFHKAQNNPLALKSKVQEPLATDCCESGTLWTLGYNGWSFFTWNPPSSPVPVQNSWRLHKLDGATSTTKDAVTRKVDTAGEQVAGEDPVVLVPLNTGLKWNILNPAYCSCVFICYHKQNQKHHTLIAWSLQKRFLL